MVIPSTVVAGAPFAVADTPTTSPSAIAATPRWTGATISES